MSETFESLVRAKFSLMSILMKHDESSKFYEVLLIKPLNSVEDKGSLCLKRYGKMSAIKSGGRLTEGKLLNTKFSGRYAGKIQTDKMARGYNETHFEEFKGGNLARKLINAGVLHHIEECSTTKDFFELYGYTKDAVVIDGVELSRETIIGIDEDVTPVVEIKRSPLFGTW